jgi:ABC-type transport system substrate-binding protein
MAGRRETDSEKRKKIYWDLEKVLYENYEDAWLFWEVAATAYRSNVMGLNREMFLKDREVFAWSHPLWFKGGKP